MGGRTLVVGDVHACASELEQLVQMAQADRIILCGDLFTKGPEPKVVWELIQKHHLESVLGNHDERLLSSPKRAMQLGLPAEALKWLSTRPLWIDGPGWRVLHAGCDPLEGAESTRRADLMNLRRWPNDAPENRFWWEDYRGSPMVIYGHDARRGLVDRRPHTLGLDTGCVYGGCLTGFIVESGEILQVSAARSYYPIQRSV